MKTTPPTSSADGLNELLDRFIGTAYSIRIMRSPPDGRFLRLVPNRGSDYADRPVTIAHLYQWFGPGSYFVEVVEPARMPGLFHDPVERNYQSCGYTTVIV